MEITWGGILQTCLLEPPHAIVARAAMVLAFYSHNYILDGEWESVRTEDNWPCDLHGDMFTALYICSAKHPNNLQDGDLLG